MSKQIGGNKKYQVDMFVGNQSFILRTDNLKEIKAFTGLSKFDSETMRKYLFELNDLTSLMPNPTNETIPAAAPVNYLEKILLRLKVMGAKTDKQALTLLKNLTGLKFKTLPKPGEFAPAAEQKIYATMLQGGTNGKK